MFSLAQITRKTGKWSSLILAIPILLLFLGGCTSFREAFNLKPIEDEDNPKEDIELPAKELLQKGMDDYNVGKYYTAVESFQDILDHYPFSSEAILAELKAADCSYYLDRYTEALALYEEFEKRHPTNEGIPYVMFQKAMCNFKQIDRIDRDTTGASKSIDLFKQLIKAYPKSPYIEDAKAKMAIATEFLANHEFCVVEYYIRTEKFDQAKVRINYMLALYPDAKISDKAKKLLARLEAGDPPKSFITSLLSSYKPNNKSQWGQDSNDSGSINE